MNVHLGDFGLAKSMTGNHDSMTSNSNMWFAGSYVTSLQATDKSDIYSLGMVLLKLVTGRKGTFGEKMDMVRWVESRIEMQGPEREELVDRPLKPLLPQEENVAFQVHEIGLRCTRSAPAERLSSRQACDLLMRVLKDRELNAEKKSLD
ncbi:putative protein kinase RLK-Pelle-LRR-XI-1 family [Helianthus debilis subsp. tardiflorus]